MTICRCILYEFTFLKYVTRETTYYSPPYDKFWLFEIFHSMTFIENYQKSVYILHFVAFNVVVEKRITILLITFYPMVRYASYHSVKYMNMNENFRNLGILAEKIKGVTYKNHLYLSF